MEGDPICGTPPRDHRIVSFINRDIIPHHVKALTVLDCLKKPVSGL